MATTVERDTVFQYQELPAVVIGPESTQPVLKAGEKVLKGTLAFIDTGKVYAAYANPPAGVIVLGIAQETYDASGSGVDLHLRMVFRRGNCFLDNDVTNPVTAAIVGLVGYAKDNVTVSSFAGGANAKQLRIVSLSPDASQVEVIANFLG